MSRNGRALALIALMVIMALSIPILSEHSEAADSDPVVEERTVYGYVTNLSDQEENTPLESVVVTLYSGSGSDRVMIDSCSTDGTGRFEFTFQYSSDQSYFLKFDYPGYTVRALPDSMNMDGENMVSFEMSSDMIDAEGKYALTETADSLHAIVMVITTGSVYGVVFGDHDGTTFELSGATVTIMSENGQSYSAQTNDSGYFIIECPYGSYILTVRCNGFQTSESIQVESGQNTPYTVVLVQNTSVVFANIDAAHATMIIAAAIFAAMLLVAVMIHLRTRKGDRDPIFINDLESLTEQEEDDVKRP